MAVCEKHGYYFDYCIRCVLADDEEVQSCMNREAEQVVDNILGNRMFGFSYRSLNAAQKTIIGPYTRDILTLVDRLVIEGRIQEIKLQQEKHYKPGSRIARLSALLSQSSQGRADRQEINDDISK